MSENIRQFIDQLAAGDAAEAKETLENELSAKSFTALDEYKKEIAKTIFGGEEEETQSETEVEVQESYKKELKEGMSQDEYHAKNDYPLRHHDMDSHNLKHLHDAHAFHSFVRDTEEHEDGGGSHGPAAKAVKAIEKHVTQKYGKHVAAHLQNSGGPDGNHENFKKMVAATKQK